MTLPSEWTPQAFAQLTWPHPHTDWGYMLEDAVDCFCRIASEIARFQPLLIAAQDPEGVSVDLRRRGICENPFIARGPHALDGRLPSSVIIVPCRNNDTWARDHAFLTLTDPATRAVTLADYQFNGWGLKFASNHDNQLNRTLLPVIRDIYRQAGVRVEYSDRTDFVLEGGCVESDGLGTILTTETCLLAPNRNRLGKQEIEARLKRDFGADRVLWLAHSWLAGDDTDGHIDTVARLCPGHTIAYTQSSDPTDAHHPHLSAMESELRALRTPRGNPYTLIPLPLPRPCLDPDDGHRLPATYANFLIINGAVLVPTYGQSDLDTAALTQLGKAFPDRQVIGVDCLALIRQHGSLHCSVMQYPVP